jgi:hypothetical protein
MLTEVALVVVQLKTADEPGAMLLGCALRVTVGFGPEVVTLTTAEDMLVPPGPAAVAVYVVVVVGVTFTEPLAGNEPRPLMVTELAFFAFQLSTVDVPLVTVEGDAFNVIVGACWLDFCADIAPPPHPMAAIKTASKKTSADMRRTNRIITPYFGRMCQTKREGQS